MNGGKFIYLLHVWIPYACSYESFDNFRSHRQECCPPPFRQCHSFTLSLPVNPVTSDPPVSAFPGHGLCHCTQNFYMIFGNLTHVITFTKQVHCQLSHHHPQPTLKVCILTYVRLIVGNNAQDRKDWMEDAMVFENFSNVSCHLNLNVVVMCYWNIFFSLF